MNPSPPFATQRVVFLAMLLGMSMFAVVAGVAIEMNDGKGLASAPLAALDLVVVPVAVCLVVAALIMRAGLQRRADELAGEARRFARFRGRLLTLALLEGAGLFATVVWLVNGSTVPSLVTAMVVLAIAIAITPFRDPDEGVA